MLTVLLFVLCFPGIFSLLGDRFCNNTYVVRFNTECAPCPQNVYVECPPDAVKLTTGDGNRNCEYILDMSNGTVARSPIKMNGCTHVCRRDIVETYCCRGFWGPDCNECPGGGLRPCNNHGVCNDTIDGTGECQCQENFDGFACEICSNSTLYGYDCDNVCNCSHGVCDSGIHGTGRCECDSGWRGNACDEEIDKCANLTCDENSRCLDVFGRVMCACNVGFERDTAAENHTCIPINICEKSNPCDGNATCLSTGPNLFNCSCNDGYYGDGMVCVAIDPCQQNHGGCDTNVTYCQYTGPGEHECLCNLGYESVGGVCELIEMCGSESDCHENADCFMVGPFQFNCTCRDGYSGNGRNCYNNLADLVVDLNRNDPDLMGSLFYASLMVQRIYSEELRYHGPFTVFLPHDKGFRRSQTSIDSFLQDEDYAKQILRQHIVVGEWTLDKLYNASAFYTLQGVKAEIQTKQRRSKTIVYRYRLSGSGNKGNILKSDILASNGIIHVVNKLLTNQAYIKGDKSKSILQLLKKIGQFNRLESLIMTAGMEANFTADNITVFASKNADWDKLPHGALAYLQSSEGLDQLRLILSHQIYPGNVEVTDLINLDRIRSSAKYQVPITVSENGQIWLNRKASISQADIPAANGLIQNVDGLILPMPINYILPSQCDYQEVIQVQGICRPCGSQARKCQQESDIPTSETEACGINRSFCTIKCNRTIDVKQCCSGFYGPVCSPCRGGFDKPCSGNGQCLDGMEGNGSCQCNPGFTGDACDQCSDPNMFGKNCSQPCTCLNGVCKNSIAGDGTCSKCNSINVNPSFSSPMVYQGPNCDKELKVCGFILSKLCHIHSTCVVSRKFKSTCPCKRGYEGDGFSSSCTPINPCEKPNRGGCHVQASCQFIGPDKNLCTCDDGWTGDGEYCYPGTICNRHRDCDPNAECKRGIGHIKELCSCTKGYHGNGTYCIPINICLENNGGCHTKATCIPTDPGQSNCTCFEGYTGDGMECIPTINQFVMDHPNLTIAAKLLRGLGDDNLLKYSLESYTFFVPTDAAMSIMMSRYTPTFWSDEQHFIDFLNFHTLLGKRDLSMLVSIEQFYGRFETMYDGFFFHVYNDNNTFSVATSTSKSLSAEVIQGDILASNGYVNIIDRALEPFIPENEMPPLDQFFQLHPEYSMFGEYLERKGLLENIMNMNQYTLFVPSNKAMMTYNKATITSDFLRYYLLPVIRLTSSFDKNEVVPTVLGPKHPIKFVIYGTKNVFINTAYVTDPDILTTGGVVHGLRNLLIPTLHKCEEKNISSYMSACVPCNLDFYTCEHGYNTVTPIDLIPGCLFKDNQSGLKYGGCNGLCVKERVISGCCAGYFGKECQECPGGPEFPCNNNGICSDGLYGNGSCVCFNGYNGSACEFCDDHGTRTACSRSCGYNNGGCHPNATCTELLGNISCSCNLGLLGDGHTCANVCDIRNGGCHKNADCYFDVNFGVNCTCKENYIGDGRICTNTRITLRTRDSNSSQIGIILGIVVGVLVVILIAIAAVVYYVRFTNVGIIERWRALRKGSDSSMTFAPLHKDPDSVYQGTTLPPSPDINFDNPLYSVKDQFGDDA